MTNDALREKLARLFHDNVTPTPWAEADEWEREQALELADIALTALGLDDLDAAVERGWEGGADWVDALDAARHRTNDPPAYPSKHLVRAVLEAALTATEGTDDAD